MMTRRQAQIGLVATAAAASAAMAPAQTLQPIVLPPARSEGGKPLTAALRLRRSTRAYSNQTLSLQTLSDLLWAAFGINRPSGDRTAPYWKHVMVMDIYAATADGVWLYEPKSHTESGAESGDMHHFQKPANGWRDPMPGDCKRSLLT
jgi:hypothetical protein